MTPITGVLETVLYAADLDAAHRFYGEILGLPLDSSQPGLFRFYRAGPAMFLVFDAEAARRNRHVPPHGTIGAGHACFAVAESALAAWKNHLTAHGVAIEHEQAWPRGGSSFYVRDPAGNSIELATPRIWGLPESVAAPA
jgi:catechol 2,3-dioxygenase-like lactoylglutathione lyase family enzyme